MKRILVPCDFSEQAQQAYQFAMNIATKTDAEILVLKVIDLPFTHETIFEASPYSYDPQIITDIEKSAKENFEKLKKQHPGKENVTFYTNRGSVTHTIRQFITHKKIDLVVMGTRGASGWKEYWIGSNTEKIVRFSPVPIFAIHKSFELHDIKNIVFPTLPRLDQTELLDKVKALQAFFSAKLHLLVVNTPFNMMRTNDEMQTMKEFANHYKLENYTINARNDFYEEDGILSFANEVKADMIAMGTHGRRGLSHLFLGSVAENVVNHIDYPIWTYSVRK